MIVRKVKIMKNLRSELFKRMYVRETKKRLPKIHMFEEALRKGELESIASNQFDIQDGLIVYSEKTTVFGKCVDIGIKKELNVGLLDVNAYVLNNDTSISFTYQEDESGKTDGRIISPVEVKKYNGIFLPRKKTLKRKGSIRRVNFGM